MAVTGGPRSSQSSQQSSVTVGLFVQRLRSWLRLVAARKCDIPFELNRTRRVAKCCALDEVKLSW
jgi:hypothetical protein